MGQPCKVCSDQTLRNQVDKLISDGLSDENVTRALASIGITISKGGILRHRQNHTPESDLSDVEVLPSEMVIPRQKLEASEPMEHEANALMESLSRMKSSDIVKERLARETLLGRILESHLLITAVALDRYKRGEGRYPMEMVKGLAAVGTLYEKTATLSTSESATKDELLEREIQRRESLAREMALEQTRLGNPPELVAKNDVVMTDLYVRDTYFRFADTGIESEAMNDRIEKAWNEGIRQGKREKPKASKKSENTQPHAE